MHGFGTFKWPDGKTYEGNYKNDVKDGEGTMTFSNGKSYKEVWKDGV